MKIGIIGTGILVDRFRKVIKKENPEAELVDLKYTYYTEAVELVERNQRHLDGILFPGRTPLKLVEKHVAAVIPWDHVPKDGSTLYRTLLEIATKRYDITRLSFDSFLPEDLYDAYMEFGVAKEDLRLLVASQKEIAEEGYTEYLYEFHKSAYLRGMCQCCVTGLSDVYIRMKKEQLPCVLLSPTSKIILQSYSKLHLKCMNQNSEKSQIVVIAVNIDMPDEYSITRDDEYLYMLNKMKVAEKVYLFGGRIAAAIVEYSTQGYLMFTTKEIIETETDNFKSIYLLDLVNETNIKNVSIGIGYGHNAKDAKFNAFDGMAKAKASGGNAAFLVYDTEEVKGPLRYHKQENNSVIDKEFTEVSEKTGISTNTLFKLYSIAMREKKTTFTSRDLAKLCDMSRRNMDRLIQKLENSGYCDVVGERMLASTGRPSRIIKLNFF